MKKIISLLLTATMISGSFSTIDVLADAPISVVINGQKIEFDQQPVIVDDRVMVPLRSIFEGMNYKVDWIQDSQTAVANRIHDKLTVQQDNNSISYEINGRAGTYLCDVPPQNISNRILVPVRAIAESSAYDVDWNGDTRTVYISNYKNGDYDLSFRSDCTERNERGIRSDITHGFNYSDEFFYDDSSVYSNDLAIVSLGVALSAFSTNESDVHYETDNITGTNKHREDNIIDTYNTLGFAGAEFYNYDKTLNASDDKTAYSFSYKNVKTDKKTFTIIPVVIRGGGYGAEWVSNFNLGNDVCHQGFLNAANEIVSSLSNYTNELKKEGLLKGDIKYWVTGYSRGAAVADIVAALINNDMQKFHAADVYGYCFATPQWINKNTYSAFSRNYSGIFNIINQGDAIPTVALSEWGYGRIGQDVYLNADSEFDIAAAENVVYALTGNERMKSAVKTVSNLTGVYEFDNTLEGLAANSSEYSQKYQQYIMDICELLCTQYSGNNGEYISLSEKFQKKHGRSVDDTLTEMDTMLLGLLTSYIESDYIDTIKCFVALARNNGVEINKQLLLFTANIVTYYIINYADSSNINGSTSLRYAHYPEIYLAWLMCNS